MLRFLILKKYDPSLISFIIDPSLDFLRYMDILHGTDSHDERNEKEQSDYDDCIHIPVSFNV